MYEEIRSPCLATTNTASDSGVDSCTSSHDPQLANTNSNFENTELVHTNANLEKTELVHTNANLENTELVHTNANLEKTELVSQLAKTNSNFENTELVSQLANTNSNFENTELVSQLAKTNSNFENTELVSQLANTNSNFENTELVPQLANTNSNFENTELVPQLANTNSNFENTELVDVNTVTNLSVDDIQSCTYMEGCSVSPSRENEYKFCTDDLMNTDEDLNNLSTASVVDEDMDVSVSMSPQFVVADCLDHSLLLDMDTDFVNVLTVPPEHDADVSPLCSLTDLSDNTLLLTTEVDFQNTLTASLCRDSDVSLLSHDEYPLVNTLVLNTETVSENILTVSLSKEEDCEALPSGLDVQDSPHSLKKDTYFENIGSESLASDADISPLCNVIDFLDDTLFDDFLYRSGSTTVKRNHQSRDKVRHHTQTDSATHATSKGQNVSKPRRAWRRKTARLKSKSFHTAQTAKLLQKPDHDLRSAVSVSACCPGLALTQMGKTLQTKRVPATKRHTRDTLLNLNHNFLSMHQLKTTDAASVSDAVGTLTTFGMTTDVPNKISGDQKWFLINNKTIDFAEIDDVFCGEESLKKLKRQIHIYRHIVQYADVMSTLNEYRSCIDKNCEKPPWPEHVRCSVLKNYISFKEALAKNDNMTLPGAKGKLESKDRNHMTADKPLHNAHSGKHQTSSWKNSKRRLSRSPPCKYKHKSDAPSRKRRRKKYSRSSSSSSSSSTSPYRKNSSGKSGQKSSRTFHTKQAGCCPNTGGDLRNKIRPKHFGVNKKSLVVPCDISKSSTVTNSSEPATGDCGMRRQTKLNRNDLMHVNDKKLERSSEKSRGRSDKNVEITRRSPNRNLCSYRRNIDRWSHRSCDSPERSGRRYTDNCCREDRSHHSLSRREQTPARDDELRKVRQKERGEEKCNKDSHSHHASKRSDSLVIQKVKSVVEKPSKALENKPSNREEDESNVTLSDHRTPKQNEVSTTERRKKNSNEEEPLHEKALFRLLSSESIECDNGQGKLTSEKDSETQTKGQTRNVVHCSASVSSSASGNSVANSVFSDHSIACEALKVRRVSPYTGLGEQSRPGNTNLDKNQKPEPSTSRTNQSESSRSRSPHRHTDIGCDRRNHKRGWNNNFNNDGGCVRSSPGRSLHSNRFKGRLCLSCAREERQKERLAMKKRRELVVQKGQQDDMGFQQDGCQFSGNQVPSKSSAKTHTDTTNKQTSAFKRRPHSFNNKRCDDFTIKKRTREGSQPNDSFTTQNSGIKCTKDLPATKMSNLGSQSSDTHSTDTSNKGENSKRGRKNDKQSTGCLLPECDKQFSVSKVTNTGFGNIADKKMNKDTCTSARRQDKVLRETSVPHDSQNSVTNETDKTIPVDQLSGINSRCHDDPAGKQQTRLQKPVNQISKSSLNRNDNGTSNLTEKGFAFDPVSSKFLIEEEVICTTNGQNHIQNGCSRQAVDHNYSCDKMVSPLPMCGTETFCPCPGTNNTDEILTCCDANNDTETNTVENDDYSIPSLIETNDVSYNGPVDSLYINVSHHILASCHPDDPRLQAGKYTLRSSSIHNADDDSTTEKNEHNVDDHSHAGDSTPSANDILNENDDANGGLTHSSGNNSLQISHNSIKSTNPFITKDMDTVGSMNSINMTESSSFNVKSNHTRRPAKLPRLSDPIIMSRLSKQQTMDILDEFCNIVRPLSPLPEEGGDYIRVPERHTVLQHCAETVTKTPCALLQGIQHLGACSVSVPCASAIQYEVCGITVVQLFGTPPSLHLEPVTESVSFHTPQAHETSIGGQTVNEFHGGSCIQNAIPDTKSSLRSANAIIHLRQAMEKTDKRTFQPNTLEKLCIHSLKRFPHFISQWMANKQRNDALHLSHNVRNENLTGLSTKDASTTKTSQPGLQNSGRGNRASVVNEDDKDNHNDNHGSETKAERNSTERHEIPTSSRTNYTDTSSELDTYVCDTMNTPIILSASDRVYHVNGGLCETSLMQPSKAWNCSTTYSHTSPVENHHKDNLIQLTDCQDDTNGVAEVPAGFRGDLLAKAMETAGLTDEVLERFLKSDFEISSFIMDNEAFPEDPKHDHDADDFFDHILGQVDENETGCQVQEQFFDRQGCPEHFSNIIQRTEPSLPQPGCSWTAAFDLGATSSSQEVFGSKRQEPHQHKERILESTSSAGPTNYNILLDECGDPVPSVSSTYTLRSNAPSCSTLVSYENGQLLDCSASGFIDNVDIPNLQSMYDMEMAEYQSQENLIVLKPVIYSGKESDLTGSQSSCILTRDTQNTSEAFDLPAAPEKNNTMNSSQGRPILNLPVARGINLSAKTTPSSGTFVPGNLEENGKERRMTRARKIRNHSTETNQDRLTGERRRATTEAACEDNEVPASRRANTKRRLSTKACHKDPFDIQDSIPNSNPTKIPFEARSLVCTDKTRCRVDAKMSKNTRITRGRKTRLNQKNNDASLPLCNSQRSQSERNKKSTGKRSSRVSKSKCEDSPCKQVHVQTEPPTDERVSVSSKSVTNRQTNSRDRKSAALRRYYAKRQATVEKFTEQLTSICPGLLTHKHNSEDWNSYQKINQISMKISCPLRFGRKMQRCNHVTHCRQTRQNTTVEELNSNNNSNLGNLGSTADEIFTSKRLRQRIKPKQQLGLGLSANLDSQQQQLQSTSQQSLSLQHQQQQQQLQQQKGQGANQRMQKQNQTSTYHQSQQENLQQKRQPIVKRPKQRQPVAPVKRASQTKTAIENLAEVRKKFSRIKDSMHRPYTESKHHMAPSSSSFTTVLQQMRESNNSMNVLRSISPAEESLEGGLSNFRRKSTLPRLPSSTSSRTGNFQDQVSRTSVVDDDDSSSVLKFVQRIDTRYGEQFARGDSETQTRLHKLCNQYYNLYNARREREKKLNCAKQAASLSKARSSSMLQRSETNEDENCDDQLTPETVKEALARRSARKHRTQSPSASTSPGKNRLVGRNRHTSVDRGPDSDDNCKGRKSAVKKSASKSSKLVMNDNHEQDPPVTDPSPAAEPSGKPSKTGISRVERNSRKTPLKKPTVAAPLNPYVAKVVDRLAAKPPSPGTRILSKIDSWEYEFGKSLKFDSNIGGPTSYKRNLTHSASGSRPKGSTSSQLANVDRVLETYSKRNGSYMKKAWKKEMSRLPDNQTAQNEDVSHDLSASSSESEEDDEDAEAVDDEKMNQLLSRVPTILSMQNSEKINMGDLPTSIRGGTPDSLDELYASMEREYFKDKPVPPRRLSLRSPDRDPDDSKDIHRVGDVIEFAPISPLNPVIPKDSPFCFLNFSDHPPVDLLSEDAINRLSREKIQRQLKPGPSTQNTDADELEDKIWGSGEQQTVAGLYHHRYTNLGKKIKKDDVDYDDIGMDKDTAPVHTLGLDEDERRYIANIAESEYSGQNGPVLYANAIPPGFEDDFGLEDLEKYCAKTKRATSKVTLKGERQRLTSDIGDKGETSQTENKNDPEGEVQDDGDGTEEAASDNEGNVETTDHETPADRMSVKRSDNGLDIEKNVDNDRACTGGSGTPSPSTSRENISRNESDRETADVLEKLCRLETLAADSPKNQAVLNEKDVVDESNKFPANDQSDNFEKNKAQTRLPLSKHDSPERGGGGRGGGGGVEQVMGDDYNRDSHLHNTDMYWSGIPDPEIGAGDGLMRDPSKLSADTTKCPKGTESDSDSEKGMNDMNDFESLQSLKRSIDISLTGMFKYDPYQGMQYLEEDENSNRIMADLSQEDGQRDEWDDSSAAEPRSMGRLGGDRCLSIIPEVDEEDEQLASAEP